MKKMKKMERKEYAFKPLSEAASSRTKGKKTNKKKQERSSRTHHFPASFSLIDTIVVVLVRSLVPSCLWALPHQRAAMFRKAMFVARGLNSFTVRGYNQSAPSFDPADLQSVHGRVFMITGANSGGFLATEPVLRNRGGMPPSPHHVRLPQSQESASQLPSPSCSTAARLAPRQDP